MFDDSLPYDQICEKIRDCEIPVEVIMDFFPEPFYRYNIELGQPFPEFPEILTTYTFKNLSQHYQKLSKDVMKTFRVNPDRAPYMKWVKELPTAESQVCRLQCFI